MTSAPSSGPPVAPAGRRSAGWVGVIVFLLLTSVSLRWFQPAPPRGFEIDVVFERGRAGASEPLIVAGEAGSADFLWIRYEDETTAVLGHDRWGLPPNVSAPFETQPGTRRRLRLDLPFLAHVRGGSRGGGDDLRVHLDGKEILSATTRFNLRKASRVYFGENPIGGSACGPEFSGTLYHLNGRELLGNARNVFTWPERIAGWVTDGKWQLILVLSTSIGIGALWAKLRVAPRARLRTAASALSAVLFTHRWFVATALLCTLAFGAVITGSTGRVFFEETFGSFYDYQAAALLHGRVDVPEAAVSGEAFIVRGKYFGYFGITPALLRLPFVIFDVGFGWLSRSYMIAQFVGALVAAYFVLCTIRGLIAPAVTMPSRWVVAIFTLTVGLGSTLFYLSSRAYIYHEANLCGATFALAASGCALRYLAAPRSRWWLGSLVCGLLSLHARPPTGLFALVLLSCAALAVVLRAWYLRRNASTPSAGATDSNPAVSNWHLALPIVCFLGVLSFNGLSYLKFQTFDGAPLKYHVQYIPGRLAHIEGKNFHLGNFNYDFGAYVWQPNFEIRKTFPYFYVTGKDPRHFPGAKIDLAESTLALPYAMPGLVFLALVGGLLACWHFPSLRLPGAVVLVAVIPMAAAMFTAVAISHRYTTDFCPWLISLAAIGLMLADGRPHLGRQLFRWIAIGLTAISIFVTIAMTLHYQGTRVWGVPPDVTERYQSLRKRVDGFFGVTNHEL